MIFIDGYNLLRAVEDSYSPPITDAQMCMLISKYLGGVHKKGKIIFDGIGPPNKQIFVGIKSLDIIFSGKYKEADDVIEELILKNTAPKRLVVVSSDRRIKAAANKRKATACGAVEFWSEMLKQLEKKMKKKAEPSQKYGGLTDGETEQWLRFFGLNKK